MGYSPWGHEETDTTEHARAHTHTHTDTHTHTEEVVVAGNRPVNL